MEQPPRTGAAVLSLDPVVEAVLRHGGLSLRELRAVAGCADTPEARAIVEARARQQLARGAAALRRSGAAARRIQATVRGLALDVEGRMAQLGVPLGVAHPCLASPLGAPGAAQPAAAYDDIATLGRVLHVLVHPSAWAPRDEGIWDAVAASTSHALRPTLAMLLSTLIPVEARLSYVTLRHSAYAGPGCASLADMLHGILLRMMSYELQPADAPKLLRRLRQGGPLDRGFVLFLLRCCRKGGDRTLQERAAHACRLSADLRALLSGRDPASAADPDALLYSPEPWLGWLLRRSGAELAALYVRYVYDGFQ